MSSYTEEMDILKGDFNTELENILKNRNIEELGIVELRRLKFEYIAVHEENLGLQERARLDAANIDVEELRNLLNAGDELYESNRVALVSIQEVLNQKVALAKQNMRERREIREQQRTNKKVIDSFRSRLNDMEKTIVPFLNQDNRQVIETAMEDLKNNIKSLEELDKQYSEKISHLDDVIDKLAHGGKIEELEVTEEEVKGLSEEEALEETNRIQEEIDKAKKDAEAMSDDKIEAKKEPEVKEEQKQNVPSENQDQIINDINNMVGPTRENPSPNINPPKPDVVVPDQVVEENVNQSNVNSEQVDMNPQRIIPDSIFYYVQTGVLPKNLTEGKIVQIANALGIPAKDGSFRLDKTALMRLQNDKEIRLAKQNEKIYGIHQQEINKFARTSESYSAMMDDRLNPVFNEALESQQTRLNSQIDTLVENQQEINADSVKEHFDMNGNLTNKLQGIRAEAFDKRADKVNEKLRAQYEILDQRALERQQAHGKIRQVVSEKRYQKVANRVARLQRKEGRITEKQFALMDSQAQKYIDAKNKQLHRYQEKQRKVQERIDKVNKYTESIRQDEQKLNDNNEDLENIKDHDLLAGIERFVTRRANKRIEKHINRLRGKIGRTELNQQIHQTLEEAFTMKR